MFIMELYNILKKRGKRTRSNEIFHSEITLIGR